LGCRKALADMIVVGGAQPVRGRAVRHPRPLREPRAIVADPVAQPEADAMHLADLAAAPGGAAQRQQHPVRPAMVVREVSEAQVVAAHGVGVYSKMSHPKEVAMTDAHPLSRRTVLKATGLGIAPGGGEYSMMNVFAGWGYDVWTVDHEGYGRSSRTEGNADIASGVEDLKAATEVVARETGHGRFHFYGGSSGALRAAAFAMVRPERVDRLILEAFTWTGKGSPTLGKRAEALEYFRTHNRRPRDRDMIRSIFTRDKPGTSDPAVAEALADAELVFGDTIPT